MRRPSARLEPVRTQQGLIQGIAGKVEGVTVFKNILFAAPPVGELRWKQPQSPACLAGRARRQQVRQRLRPEPGADPVSPNAATDTENFTG